MKPPSEPRAQLHSRRELLAAGSLGLGAMLSAPACASSGASPQRGTGTDADLLDEALERIAAIDPEVRADRTNHAPMVAEALASLGRADAIRPWIDGYGLERSVRAPAPGQPIDSERWRDALGHIERYADWRVLFARALDESDWRSVVRLWTPRLAPGLVGHALHGVIRTAHAVRSVAARDTVPRKAELASAFAFWAARYEELPWDGRTAAEPTVRDALARVQTYRPERRAPGPMITHALASLDAEESFRDVAGLVDLSDPLRTLSEVTVALSELYLRNPEYRIAFAHGVTGPSALRLLAPYLDEQGLKSGVRYAWQAAAALYAAFASPTAARAVDPEVPSTEELVEQAIETGGAHAIKLTEACLRENAVSRERVLLAAAADAAKELTS